MTDYVMVNGRSSSYPAKYYGANFVGSRATFFEDADFGTLDANALAIPNLPITVLSASPVQVGEEFFGTHVYQRVNDGNAALSAKTVRSQDLENGTSRWHKIQPTATTWNWNDMDAWVNTHSAAGRDLIHVLWGTPAWASARPTEPNAYSSVVNGVHYNEGLAAEPADMTKWDAYCTAVATRYQGKIKNYEVWNEVNFQNNGSGPTGTGCYFSGTYAKLAEMVRRANQAIKAVDPAAKIISPNTQGWVATPAQQPETYFTGMMSASDGASGTMKDWVDIIGVHLYLPPPNRVQDLSGIIDRINAAKITAGVSNLPTWDTESSMITPTASTLTDSQICQYIGRFFLTVAAKGIARTSFYQWDRIADYGFSNRPVAAAYREMIKTLLMSGTILTVCRFTDGRVAYRTNSGTTII